MVEDLKKEDFQKERAIVLRVPQWVFAHSDFNYMQNKYGEWEYRQDCRGQVKFFYIGEKLRNVEENILTHINILKEWVPAKEIFNENSSAISA